MRNPHQFRPAVGEPLEDRSVPSGFGGLLGSVRRVDQPGHRSPGGLAMKARLGPLAVTCLALVLASAAVPAPRVEPVHLPRAGEGHRPAPVRLTTVKVPCSAG